MDDSIRVSDADRDRVTAQLRDHFAAGRITPGELDQRLSAALNARTFGDLRRIMADLTCPGPFRRCSVRRRPHCGSRPAFSPSTTGPAPQCR